MAARQQEEGGCSVIRPVVLLLATPLAFSPLTAADPCVFWPNRQASLFAGANVVAAGAAAVSVGTMAWYTSLYGNPFLPEYKAESAADHGLHPPAYPWSHKGPFETFDHAS